MSGVSSLKEFWGALRDRSKCSYSYQAVRNYHSGRDAPADYFVCVANAFDVRLEWLLTGEGLPTEVEQRANLWGVTALTFAVDVSAFSQQAAQPIPFAHLLSPAAMALFWEMWKRYVVGGEVPKEQQEELARALGRGIAAPLQELGITPDRSDALSDYFSLMCQSLIALAPLYRPDAGTDVQVRS